jgi:hypothetical protein
MGGIGSGGNGATSDYEKRLRGTFKPYKSKVTRIDGGEFQEPGQSKRARAPSAPRDLPEAAQTIWRSIVPEIVQQRMTLSALDLEKLRALCVATVEMRAAEANGTLPPGVWRRWYPLAVHFGRAEVTRRPAPKANPFAQFAGFDDEPVSPRQQRSKDAARAEAQARLTEILAGHERAETT